MQKISLRNALVFSCVALLAACQPIVQDGKYPYFPQFVDTADVPPTILPPPPKVNSKTHKAGINAVLNNQRVATAEQIAAAQAEDKITPQMITLPVLGEDFTEWNYPATYDLLRRSGSDSWRIGDTARDYWKFTRPWLVDDRVALHVSPIKIPSYPSGHTLTNHVWARILADLFPGKRVELFRRADDIANHRVIAGVHYPFDIIAGIKMADATYCKMKAAPAYREAFIAAAKEIQANPPAHFPHGQGLLKTCH